MFDVQTAHTVLARFDDMTSARRGIAALERAGIPGSDIRLEGRSAEEAARQADTSSSDEAFMRAAQKTVLKGAGVGAGTGAVVGLVAGLVLLGPSWPAVAITVAAGIAGGGGLGFVVNAIADLQQTDAAELTYHNVDDSEVRVAVRTNDREDSRKAAERLRRADAVSVEQLDADGAR